MTDSCPLSSARPRIYVASKVHRAAYWRDLRAIYNIVSRWIDAPADIDIETYRRLWIACIDDVRAADMMVLRAADGETLKGCLIEAGGMLALGRPVYQIGDCHSLRAGDGSDASFVQHPLWHKVETFPLALRHWGRTYAPAVIREAVA